MKGANQLFSLVFPESFDNERPFPIAVQELQNGGGRRACERLSIPSCGLSPIVLVVVLVLVVD
jgi:hypothetical protein